MKYHLLIVVGLFLGLFLGTVGYSQGLNPTPTPLPPPSSEHLPLAESEEARGDTRACAYSSFLLSYLDQEDDVPLQSSFKQNYENYTDWLKTQSDQPFTKQERRLQNQILQDLSILAFSSEYRTHLQKTFEALCVVGRKTSGAAVKTVAMSASAVTSAMTLPLRFLAKIGIGIATRKESSGRGPGYLDLTGGKAGVGNWLSVVYEAIRVAFYSTNPVSFAVDGITSIDIQAQSFCRNDRPKTEREQSFCESYEKLKKGEYTATEEGRVLGVKLGNLFFRKFDFRSDSYLNPNICSYPLRKQFRVAKRAKTRLEYQLISEGIEKPDVLVIPGEIGGCISLRVQNLSPDDYKKLTLLGDSIIDGLAYALELKADAPSDSHPNATASPVPSPTPDYHTDDAICRAVYGLKIISEAERRKSLNTNFEVLQMMSNPGRFAKPNIQAVPMPDSLMVREPVSRLSSGRNIILIIAPTDDQRKEYEAIKPKWDEMGTEYRLLNKKLDYLGKGRDYDACMERQKFTHFDYLRYLELGDELRKIQVADRVQQYEAMLHQANHAGTVFLNHGDRLKLNWEIMDMKSLNDVHSLLQDISVQNLIVVSHGEENGKVVDARLNELPHVAFNTITPNLQSISFFSCHSKKAIDSYDLINTLSTQKSFHQIRYVGNVISAAFLEEANEAPVNALKSYIENVDERLYRDLVGNSRVQLTYAASLPSWQAPELCQIHFEGLKITKGAFNIKINRNWAGTYYPGEENQAKDFPCTWITNGANVINFENPSLTESSTLAVEGVILSIDGGVKKGLKASPSIVKRRTEDSSIATLRWDF